MSRLPPGLIQRTNGGNYSFRKRVPADLIESVGKKEIVISLGTRDLAHAKQRYHEECKRVEAEFERHRASSTCEPISDANETRLSKAQRARVCSAYLERRINEEHTKQYRTLEAARADEQAFWRGDVVPIPQDWLAHDQLTFWFDVLQNGNHNLEDGVAYILAYDRDTRAKALNKARMISDISEFLPIAKKETTDTNEVVILARDVLDTEIAVLQKLQEGTQDIMRLINGYTETHSECGSSDPQSISDISQYAHPGSPLLSIAGPKFINEGKRSNEDRKNLDSELCDFQAIVGDKPIASYTKTDGRLFKETITSLTPNWRKYKTLRDLDIVSASAACVAQGLPPIHTTTINKRLNYVGRFFIWANKNFDSDIKNPVQGLGIKAATSPEDEHDPFTQKDLTEIFAAPVFCGCKSERYWNQPGSEVLFESPKYWLPLLALFTGARLGEIAALDIADVRDRDSIKYLQINKALKNGQSKRIVPVHSELVRLGFLDFVQRMKQRGQARLFPNLRQDKTTGRYSDVSSKAFTRFLKTHKIKRPKISFHSFRHNFEDAARDCGLEQVVTDRLMGHKSPGMSARYGKGHSLERLNSEIQKIHYRDLDLRHLHVPKD